MSLCDSLASSIVGCAAAADAVEWSAAASSLLASVLVGKRKHGSASVDVGVALCTLHTVDEQRFVIRAAVRGRLLEVNERLMNVQTTTEASMEATSSGLFESDSEWNGYVGIVLMDKPQLYDLIDETDSRYLTTQRWRELQSSTATASGNHVR